MGHRITQLVYHLPSELRALPVSSPLGGLMHGGVHYSWAVFGLQETVIQLLLPNVLARLSVCDHMTWVGLAVNVRVYSLPFCIRRWRCSVIFLVFSLTCGRVVHARKASLATVESASAAPTL